MTQPPAPGTGSRDPEAPVEALPVEALPAEPLPAGGPPGEPDEPAEEPTGRGRPASWRSLALLCLLGWLLGAAGGGLHYVLQPPQYTAVALVTTTIDNVDDLGQLRWSQALARIALSPQLAGPALREAGLPEMADEPRRFAQTAAAPDTPVFSVRVRARDAGDAQRAANAIADRSASWSDGAQLPMTVRVTHAALPADPTPGLLVRVVLGSMLGLLTGLTFFLLRRDRALSRVAEDRGLLRASAR